MNIFNEGGNPTFTGTGQNGNRSRFLRTSERGSCPENDTERPAFANSL